MFRIFKLAFCQETTTLEATLLDTLTGFNQNLSIVGYELGHT
jgi:hypothetical protein